MKNRLQGVIRPIYVFVFLYLLIPVQNAVAASKPLNLENVDPQVAPMPSMFGLFLRLIVSLLIIVGIAFVTMRLLRKNMTVLSRGANIKVLDQYAFSMNKGVYITEIAGKVYVLGVTDANINLITEVTDDEMIDEIVTKAREREMEPVIPPSILERFLPGTFNQSSTGSNSFNKHIQKQIKKLQLLVDNRVGVSREDDKDEK